jgi:hypothetical protein
MMTIYEPVAVMVSKMVAKATECKRRKKECAKKAFYIENGYVVERLVPSGKFKVRHEGVGCMVIVDSLKQAKIICKHNTESE